MRSRRPDQRGETLVEVVMALGILSLVLVSSYALATGTFRLGRGAGQRSQAVSYLQEQAEALRSFRNKQSAWQPFVDSMNLYSGKAFCMKQVIPPATGIKQWQPVDASDLACSKEGIAIEIKATPQGAPVDQYNYDFVARWKTGSADNTVTLTTKLVRQQ